MNNWFRMYEDTGPFPTYLRASTRQMRMDMEANPISMKKAIKLIRKAVHGNEWIPKALSNKIVKNYPYKSNREMVRFDKLYPIVELKSECKLVLMEGQNESANKQKNERP